MASKFSYVSYLKIDVNVNKRLFSTYPLEEYQGHTCKLSFTVMCILVIFWSLSMISLCSVMVDDNVDWSVSFSCNKKEKYLFHRVLKILNTYLISIQRHSDVVTTSKTSLQRRVDVECLLNKNEVVLNLQNCLDTENVYG